MKGEGSNLAATVALLTVLLAVAGWWGFEKFVRVHPDPPAAKPTPPPTDAGAVQESRRAEARIISVKGNVQRGAHPGPWTPVREGDTLREHERIRTGEGGTAELSVDEKSAVLVSESTEVGVEEINRAVHRFRLVRGRVTADYDRDGRRALRIEGASGQVAEAENAARFSVLATEETFTLATERGQVNLASAGAVVTVEAGQQASASGGRPPAAATPIPAEVLLLATGKSSSYGCLEIQGEARPGSEVTVAGTPAAVDSSGQFRVRLDPELRKRQQITVRMRDALGRVEEKLIVCRSNGRTERVSDIEIRGWRSRPR
jgi:FecR protein